MAQEDKARGKVRVQRQVKVRADIAFKRDQKQARSVTGIKHKNWHRIYRNRQQLPSSTAQLK